ncbi:MAG: DUF2784 domain-containing protein [Bacteroidales bacterium]
MVYQLLADLTLVLHLIFILFVMMGALFVLKWRWFALIHAPAAIWGALIEFMGWICPLTPLENSFRHKAGQSGYEEGFIDHYLIPIIYPQGLTSNLQFILGAGVIVLNIAIYWFVIKRISRYRNKNL